MYWDPRSSTPLFKVSPSDGRFDLGGITSLAVNPSSTLVVVGGASGDVRVVSLNKGEVVGALKGHAEGESVEVVQFVDISGNGSYVVVTGATDGKACIWDLSTMRLRGTLAHQVPCLSFESDDGANIATLGCNNNASCASTTQVILVDNGINRQDPAHLGRSHRSNDRRTQGSPRTGIGCSAWLERRCGG
jgi:WD40 repeat protein